MKKEIIIKRYKSGQITEEKDFVASEKNIELLINNKAKLNVSMSPGDLNAFAYGFLLTSGLIKAKGDVRELTILGDRIEVELPILPKEFKFFLPSGCGGGSLLDVEIPKRSFKEILFPDLENLPVLFKQFNCDSAVFAETGGVHSAAISDGNAIRFFSEDIGRHNAVDKVIGKALLQDVDFNSLFLLTSGRISAEIVKKVFYAGLRSIVSRSAPTCAAIVRARRSKIGIIGFLRGSRFNIYT